MRKVWIIENKVVESIILFLKRFLKSKILLIKLLLISATSFSVNNNTTIPLWSAHLSFENFNFESHCLLYEYSEFSGSSVDPNEIQYGSHIL